MELSAHPAMAADARLRRHADGLELRLVAQATFLLVSGPTEIVSAEELDEDAARWLDDAAAPDGAAVVVVGGGAGASRLTADGEVVRLGPEGRGDRRMPPGALRPGAELAMETDDAGTVATRLPDEGPRAWLDVGGTRRPLTLQPIAVRIDLVGLRLSIVWCASAAVDAGTLDGAHVVVHTDAAPSGAAPRSARPPAPARTIAIVDASPTPVRVEAPSIEWDIDSTVSIDGPGPASLPLPFVGARPERERPPSLPEPERVQPPALSEPERVQPPALSAPLERRSIGQILAERRPPPAHVATTVAQGEAAGPARAGRMRMGDVDGDGQRAVARHGAVTDPVPAFMLLHVEPGASARLRRATSWRTVLQAPNRAAQRSSEQAGEDKAAARDARDAVAALRGAAAVALPAIGGEIEQAVDDGLFVAPILVVEGALELPLDPTGLLRATAEAVAPLCPTDRRLEEAHARVKPFLDAPWLDRAVAEAERATLLAAVASVGRGQTAEALDAQVERKLRRDRRHVTRSWQGAEHVLAVLVAGDGEKSARAQVLLPRAAVDRMPLARRFRARLLVEAYPTDEPDDGDAPVLIAIAVTRELVTS